MSRRGDSSPSLESYVRSVVRAVGVQLLLVTLLTGLAFGYLRLSLGPRLEGAIDDARTVRVIHEAMLDQETNLRAFLITRDSDLRVQYEEARSVMVDATTRAEVALASGSSFGDEFVALRLAQQRWVEQWAEPAARSGPETFATPGELDAFIRAGKSDFEAYRMQEDVLIDKLTEERGHLLDQQQTLLAIAATIALVTGITLLALTLRERRRINELIVDPVDDLRRTMERISKGDFTARPQRAGTMEMQQLADSLDEMSDQLHDALRVVAEQSATITERAASQASILTMARDVAGSLNAGYVQRAVAEQARRLASADVASVWLVRDDGKSLQETWRQDGASSEPGLGQLLLGQGLAGEVARDGRAKTTDEKGTSWVSVHTDHPVASLGMPMVVGGRVMGIIEICFEPPLEIDLGTVSMIETLAAHAGTAIEAARLHEATREMSHTDPLTLLYNRRRMDEDLAAEVARSLRYGNPLAFAMTDLDRFKQFNDTYGHQRGDEVLQGVAQVLAGSVRSTDTVYRYGGEEMSILFRDTTVDAARELADRLRLEVERRFPGAEGQRAVTISMGVAGMTHEMKSADQVVRAADAALYEAKAAGRNQVAMAEQPRLKG